MAGKPIHAGTPEAYQPLGKDYPLRDEDIVGEKDAHLAAGSNAYENMTGDDRDPELRRTGAFEVPDDDLAGEGWSPPTRAGGGWEHPVEPALEERLDEVEGSE
ncbi:MAG: hypothetical protein ACR2IE_18425 [Candidatus Sumerlaeaceae bacterium]